nr:RecName: Full=40 kDa cell wall protein [Solanum lycopersicum]
ANDPDFPYTVQANRP